MSTAMKCLLLLALPLAAQSPYKLTYQGGTIGIKPGIHLIVTVSQSAIRMEPLQFAIFPEDVRTLTYTHDPRHIPIPSYGVPGLANIPLAAGLAGIRALAATDKHYISIGWAREMMIFQAGSDYRGILADLEGTTGRKAVFVK